MRARSGAVMSEKACDVVATLTQNNGEVDDYQARTSATFPVLRGCLRR